LPWHSYVASFWAGAFILNALPHLIQGVSGRPFPSPFASPPGKGLSSPLVNAVWGLVNLGVGVILCHVGENLLLTPWTRLSGFAGFASMALLLANHFGKVAPHRRSE